jgi:hypothetical protein
MEANLKLIEIAGYDEGADSLTSDIVLWPRVSVLFANAAAFDRLSQEQQAALRQAAIDVREARLTWIRGLEDEGLTILCRRGIQLIAGGASALADLREAVAPVYADIARDPLAAAVVDDARRLGADTAEPDSVECPDSPPSPPPSADTSPTPLEGAWQTCVTGDEMASAGADAGENTADNLGCHVLLFEGDRFWVYRPGAEPGSGGATFNADGTIDVDDAAQTITFNLENGEQFVYKWSRHDDTLSLEKVSVGPTALVVKPYTRSDK